MVKKATIFMKFVNGQVSRGYCVNRITLTNREVIAKRNALFSEEQERQAALVRRVEKIRVKYTGIPKECTMVMNKSISTPADCLRHLPERMLQLSVLAYVNGEPWDMSKPLEEDCELNFAHFKDFDPRKLLTVNKAFWRSCSYLLGFAIERSFKEDHRVLLHSWPAPQIKSGSFVYDAVLPLENWEPNDRELRALGNPVRKLQPEKASFERLEVEPALAKEIFEDNPYKHSVVDSFAESTENKKVILYRCKDHVDISRGPMIGNTGFIRDFGVASVHAFETGIGLVYRFQGIAYPSAFTMSPFALGVLRDRAKIMNTTGLPNELNRAPGDSKSESTTEAEVPDTDDENEQTTQAHKAAQ
ncbi:39S ribosomal protein L39, mitochondrial [Galendromus occidentalis]|uniref:39S ribosomal protein L39, mitochondrial n=1 Tax=Galendromus occidentalis TaxID=34638 RepID=A0AAJ6QRB8_9ACAR|nr:39S ribosomal protein L39, mitochondrial [Galendromus occidentalis]